MNKTFSEMLMKLRDEAVEKYGVTDWGITHTNDRWIAGFLIKHKRFVGSGDTPQQAYIRALHDVEGTDPPPF